MIVDHVHFRFTQAFPKDVWFVDYEPEIKQVLDL